jgi:hypothetical protein
LYWSITTFAFQIFTSFEWNYWDLHQLWDPFSSFKSSVWVWLIVWCLNPKSSYKFALRLLMIRGLLSTSCHWDQLYLRIYFILIGSFLNGLLRFLEQEILNGHSLLQGYQRSSCNLIIHSVYFWNSHFYLFADIES